MTPKALIWTIVAVALAIAIPLGAYAAGGSGAQSDDTAASHATKTLTPNNDGTYNLSINVTGSSTSSSSQEVTPVDIVLVLDVSGSMDEPISWTGTTKMDALKSAVNSFLDSTAAQNEKISDDNSKIRVSLVKFAGRQTNAVGNDMYREGGNRYNYSQIVSDFTTDMSGLETSVSRLMAAGTTSADYGMSLAQSQLNSNSARSGAQKYVIFFTDGEPNHYKGFDSSVANSAISAARALKSKGTTIYSIGVLSDADPYANPTSWGTSPVNKYMQAVSSNYPNAESYTSLGEGNYLKGYYKAATSSSELSSIFADIFNDISQEQTVTDVSITDHLTGMTATALVDGKADNFTYTKTDAEGNTTALEGFPTASFSDGTITWNLGETILNPAYTYTVTAKVWPRQDALDLVADLNNGTKQYSDLTADQQAQLQLVDNVYTLYTNPTDGNTISYKTVTTKTSSKEPSGTWNDDGTITGDDGFTYTKNAAGTWSGTKTSDDATTDAITNPSNGMAVNDQQVSFEKIWEGGTTTQTSLTAELQRDDSDYDSVTVTSDNNWTTKTNVAMGIIDKDGTVLESGHDYTVTEPSNTDYHFEYSGETYRPMLINNVPTVLVKIAGQEDGAYQIDGSWYKPAAATGTITATNVRKSTLNLSKTVVDNSANSDAPADALFTFTAKVTDSKASDGNVWFSIQDASGNIVEDADRVSGATAETGDTGYYYAASGNEITLKLKDGDNVRFINVSTGATYSFAETAMDNGFSFTSAEATVSGESASSNEGTVNDQTVSGTVSQANKTYQVAFKDTYDATKPQDFTAMKTVSGYDWTKSADIRISATGNNAGYVKIPTSAITQTVSNIKNGESQQVTFTGVEFLAEGTYTLNVKETTAADLTSDKGWMYDNSDHAITVTVAKGRDGKLAVTKVEGDNPTITNTYKPSETTVDTDAEGSAFLTKAYDVADGLAPTNKTFDFSIAEVDVEGNAVEGGYSATGTATYESGKTSDTVNLGTITYTEPGTHYYKVTEATADGDGWSKAENSDFTVTVVVTDNGDGTLSATVSGTGTITNTYEASSTELNTSTGFAQKNVTSPNPTKDSSFSFTLTCSDDAPMPQNADGNDASSASVTYVAGESGTKDIAFGTITYTKPGTYNYTVTESDPASGWTATTKSATVTVTVKDNGNGTLTAAVYAPGTIVNSYKAAATDPVTIEANKTLTGAPLMAGEFSFTLTGNNGAPMPSQTKAANVGDGSITFGPITYTEAGTYTYTVAEVNDGKSGFTYDSTPQTVTVDVTDNGEGQLVAEVTGTPVFSNSYKAQSGKPVVLTAQKVLEGRTLKEGQFSFQLFDESGNAVGEPVANDASGSITFPELNYTQLDFEGNGVEAGDNGTRTKTVTYTAKEVVPDEKAAGYTYSDNVATYSVKLVDDGAGNITATLESSDSTTFTNTYKASPVTAEAFKATKELTGRTINAGEFEFQLTDEAGNVVETVSNAADGTVTFSPITYKLSDLNNAESKTFTYTISEVGNGLGGVTYDTAKHKVSVTVTDNGDGTLTASKPVYDGNSETAPTFTNTYQAAPEVVALPTVTKTVAGDQTDTYPTFSFVIEAQDGAPSLDNADGSSVTKTLDGPGSVDFGSVTFSAAGQYTYKVYEVAGDSEGWTYDGNVYTLKYTVTDNGNGGFDVVPTITNSNGETVDAVSFENTYTKPVVPEPAKPAPKVPDTGDTTSTALPVGLACIAVVAIAAGFIIKRKSNGSK